MQTYRRPVVPVVVTVACAGQLLFWAGAIAQDFSFQNRKIAANNSTSGKSADGGKTKGADDDDYVPPEIQDLFPADRKSAGQANQERNYDPRFSERLQWAQNLIGRRDWKGAKRYLLNGLEFEKKSEEAYSELGLCQYMLGETGEAKQSLNRAIQLNPKYTPAYLRLATVCQRLGDLTEAEATLMTCLRYDPGSVAARRQLAALHAPAGAPSVRFNATGAGGANSGGRSVEPKRPR